MHPVLKRILLHGGGTALVLAAIGLVFAEMAGMWNATGTKPASAELNRSANDSIRYRIPLMMAFWGFAFVAVSELVLSRFRKSAPPKPVETPQDDAEKLLNELLAQAEAKMALEAESQQAESSQTPENPERNPEGSGQQPEASHRSDAGENGRAGPSVL
jgi:hypothetical protein